MRLLASMTGALMALVAMAAAAVAEAEVTVSQSNDPSVLIGEQLAPIFGAEHKLLKSLPETKLTALAIGPGHTTKPGKNKPPYTLSYLSSLPAPKGGAGWSCLRKAIYFEARGESLQGEFAVAEVILNRVDSPDFPDTICSVVEQTARGGRGGCAFSWYCDGKSDVMYDKVSADRAGRIAWLMMQPGEPRPLTAGATYFHTRAVKPGWGRYVIETAAIGGHLFFRQP